MSRFTRIEIMDDDETVLPIRPIRRVEVEALIELGHFEDERLELLDGSLVTLHPPMNTHTIVSSRVAAMLARQLGTAWAVRQHCYLALDEHSMPQPDVVVIASPRSGAGPGSTPVRGPGRYPAPLVVEVTDATFAIDSIVKALLYGEAGIPTYWMIDLVHGRVRVHDTPIDGRYRSIEICGRSAVLTASALPALALPVGEVLAAL